MGEGKNKKVFIWTESISDLFIGTNIVGGIAIQLYFWSQVFRKNGWEVHTMTHFPSFEKEGIRFHRNRKWLKTEIFHDWVTIIWILIKHRPQIIISRGASRSDYALSVVSRWFKIKYILFGASDTDFQIGKELIVGEYNRKLYQKAIPKIDYFVVQNSCQQQYLKHNYNKDSLVIPNIWLEKAADEKTTEKEFDVIWVANLRKLKRPEWLMNAARKLPELKFAMVGGPTADKQYFDEIKEEANLIPNLTFFGQQSFQQTNELIGKSRILTCTSEFEGFPNTFLQAWAQKIPVVSTVDPSGVIENYNLGRVVDNEKKFVNEIVQLVSDKDEYMKKQKTIETYFTKVHSAEKNYIKLINYLNIQE